MKLGDCLDEVVSGVGAEWARYPVLGATRAGIALAKEPVGKQPERYKLVTPGTVFYNPMRILLGSIAMVDEGEPAGITSPDYVVFRPKPGVLHHRWLYYWLRSADGAALIKSLTRGAVRERLLFRRLAAGEFSPPSYAAQQRFAEAVQHVAHARAAAEARLEAVSSLSTAILTAHFSGLTGSRARRVEEFADTCSGSTPDRGRPDYFGGDVPWVKTAELSDGSVSETEERVTRKAVSERSLRLLPPGTVLIAMYGQGQTRGRTGLLSVEATTNQACFAVLPNPQEFDSKYLQLWFRSRYASLRKESAGRGGNQSNLNGQLLRQQLVPLPPLRDQRGIVAKLGERLNSVALLEHQVTAELTSLDALPAALLRRAFSRSFERPLAKLPKL